MIVLVWLVSSLALLALLGIVVGAQGLTRGVRGLLPASRRGRAAGTALEQAVASAA